MSPMPRELLILVAVSVSMVTAQFDDLTREQIIQARKMDIDEVVLTDLDEPTEEAIKMKVEKGSQGEKRSYTGDLDSPLASALYDPNDPDECGFCHTDLRLGANGTIQSPNFPDPYPNDLNCLWLLQTHNVDHRIKLTCDVVQLESCGPLDITSPTWKDYLIISPLWSFKKSYVYCGYTTAMQELRHTSLCDKLAVSFRTNFNGNNFQGFHCTYTVFE